MHVQRVITNETCNQNCWFCNARRPAEEPAFVAKAAVWRRIAEAQSGGTREIVLTGGEPTLRSDIADSRAREHELRKALRSLAEVRPWQRRGTVAELAGRGLL